MATLEIVRYFLAVGVGLVVLSAFGGMAYYIFMLYYQAIHERSRKRIFKPYKLN